MDFGYPRQWTRRSCVSSSRRRATATRPRRARRDERGLVALGGHQAPQNEIFLDVIEKLNLLASSNGTVLNSEIVGAVRMKSLGMPELKLGLNDKLMFEATGRPMTRGKAVELEDITHQCVRLARFGKHVSFIPPDGEFDLMTYRLCTRQAAHLGRGGRRAALALAHRVHDQGQEPVQVALDCEPPR